LKKNKKGDLVRALDANQEAQDDGSAEDLAEFAAAGLAPPRRGNLNYYIALKMYPIWTIISA